MLPPDVKTAGPKAVEPVRMSILPPSAILTWFPTKRRAPKPTLLWLTVMLPLGVWNQAVPPTVSGPPLPMLPKAELAVRFPLTADGVAAAPRTNVEPKLPSTEMVTFRALNATPPEVKTSEVGSSRITFPLFAVSDTTPWPAIVVLLTIPPPRRTPPKPVSMISPFPLFAVNVPFPPPGIDTVRRLSVPPSLTAIVPLDVKDVSDNGPKLLLT